MGLIHSNHSHTFKKIKGQKREHLAVFADDNPDPIFQKDGLRGQIISRPTMLRKDQLVAPVVPKALPPDRIKGVVRNAHAPVPPPRVESRASTPTTPQSENNLISRKNAIRRNTSNLSSVSSRSNEAHKCHHESKILLIAKHRFLPVFDNELPIEEGDQLYLLSAQLDESWWYVETKNHQTGFVPATHVKRAEIHAPWYAGNIPRIVAEQRIMQPNLKRGTFLIRENPTKQVFVLSVRNSDSTHYNYIIHKEKNESRYSMRNGENEAIIFFESLEQLVDHFMNPLENDENDVCLCTTLRVPAPPLPPKEDYVMMSRWQIDRNSLKIYEQVGSGQYGRVMRGKLNNVNVAVKMMHEHVMDEQLFNSFNQEAKFLSTLNHPNLIHLIAVCMIQRPHYIITEYMDNGSLLNFLKKGIAENHVDIESAMNIAAQVASGMSYLAANNQIHRDLAARNVLVGDISSNNIPQVKVGDFGLARQLPRNDPNYCMKTDNMMAVKWMAPEGFNDYIFNTKTDVWSYGILLWEIGSMGETPYSKWSFEHTMEQINNGYRLPRPKYCPSFIYDDALLPCLNADPNKRPTFEQLFKYFDDDIRIDQAKISPKS